MSTMEKRDPFKAPPPFVRVMIDVGSDSGEKKRMTMLVDMSHVSSVTDPEEDTADAGIAIIQGHALSIISGHKRLWEIFREWLQVREIARLN